MSVLELRCARCRALLAALVSPGASKSYQPNVRFKPWVGVVEDTRADERVLRFGRCEKCYLWRGNFVGRLESVREASPTPGAIPTTLSVSWAALRPLYLQAMQVARPVTVLVDDTGRVVT